MVGRSSSRAPRAGTREADASPSPYRHFNRSDWAALRENMPDPLPADDLVRLRSLNDRLDPKEVDEVYLPLSRLLALHVAASHDLFEGRSRFLGTQDGKVPYVIGIAGS